MKKKDPGSGIPAVFFHFLLSTGKSCQLFPHYSRGKQKEQSACFPIQVLCAEQNHGRWPSRHKRFPNSRWVVIQPGEQVSDERVESPMESCSLGEDEQGLPVLLVTTWLLAEILIAASPTSFALQQLKLWRIPVLFGSSESPTGSLFFQRPMKQDSWP